MDHTREDDQQQTIDHLQRLLDHIPQIVSYVDGSHRYRIANRAYEKFFGVRLSEVIGRHPRDVMGKEAYRQVAGYQKAALRGEPQEYDTHLQLPNGNRHHFHVRYHPHIIAGKVHGFLAVVDSTDERLHAQEVLRESEEKYKSLVDNLPGIAYQFLQTTTGRQSFTFIGRRCKELFGLNAETIMADPAALFDLIPAADAGRVQEAIRLSAERLTPYALEHRIVRRDGGTVWLYASSTPRKTANGDIVWDGIGLDITTRKKTEARLLQSLDDIKIREEIAGLFLTSPKKTLFSDILEILRHRFQSRFGYIGYIDENGDLLCPSMTLDIWEECRIPQKSICFAKENWGGLWGKSLSRRCSIRQNGGLETPAGHLPLENTLIVPLLVDAQLIGQIALANADQGYSEEDQEQLESFAEFIAFVLKIYLEKEAIDQELRASILKLEQTNIALNVIIDNRDEDKKKLCRSLRDSFDRLVFPYHDTVSTSHTKQEILTLLEIIKHNTQAALLSLDSSALPGNQLFTPRESQVADLIRAGKTSKEIAAILNLSPRSVFFHRDSIRRKLNIAGTKTNLRTFLGQSSG